MFFITGLVLYPERNESTCLEHSRCFGYYETFEEANSAVRRNVCDIHECTFQYAVIEEISYGIHAIAEKRWFYQFDFASLTYFAIEEPEVLRHICNFAIG